MSASSSGGSFASAIDLLHDAAVSPELWPNALESFERVFQSNAAHFFLWNRRADRPTLSIPSTNYLGQSEFRRQYGRMDPRRLLLMQRAPGFILLCHEHFNEDFIRKSDFFNEFSLPVGRRWVMTTTLWEEAGTSAVFAVFRPPGAPHYSEADRSRLRSALPQLRRAFRLDQTLRAARAETSLCRSFLDALPQALFATDITGRLCHANLAGDRLLLAGLLLSQQHGRLITSLPSENASFQAAVQRAGRGANKAGPNGQATPLVVRDRDGSQFGVAVSPLHAGSAVPDIPVAARVLISVVPLGSQPALPDLLRRAFGLTSAEAQLAAALAAGARLSEFADTRGVRMPTVRAQLRSVFNKTGTNRQSELTRLLAKLPAVEIATPGR